MADYAKSIATQAGRLLDQGLDIAGRPGYSDWRCPRRCEAHGDL